MPAPCFRAFRLLNALIIVLMSGSSTTNTKYKPRISMKIHFNDAIKEKGIAINLKRNHITGILPQDFKAVAIVEANIVTTKPMTAVIIPLRFEPIPKVNPPIQKMFYNSSCAQTHLHQCPLSQILLDNFH